MTKSQFPAIKFFIVLIIAIGLLAMGFTEELLNQNQESPKFQVIIQNGCNRITYNNCIRATVNNAGTYFIDEKGDQHWFSPSVQSQLILKSLKTP